MLAVACDPAIEATYGRVFYRGSAQPWMDYVQYTAHDKELEECAFAGWGHYHSSNCRYNSVAGVRCEGKYIVDGR